MCCVRIFLTGEPGVGKTTAVRQIVVELAKHGKRASGMISSETRETGERIGFQLEDISTHEMCILASKEIIQGNPTVGRYYVNVSGIEKLDAHAIEKATNEADVIIIDEIGPMELKSSPFILAVESALASKKHIIGTIHRRYSHRWIDSIKSNPKSRIIEVTSSNKHTITSMIVNELVR